MIVCVLLPRFALAVAAGGRERLAAGPAALAPEPGREQLVGEVNALAETAGVHAGMRLGEALARCPALALVPPDPVGVADAWEEVVTSLEGIGAAVEATGLERFVYVSSSMVFEQAKEYPTTEEHIWTCPVPRSAYGFSKLQGEVHVRAADDEFGLPWTICRPFNAYGPGELPEDEPGIAHMVPDVIRKVLTLPPGAALPIFGDGTQTRTITHIDDIADGVVTAMGAPAALREDFNISAGEEMTVAQIAGIIWAACGRDPSELRFEHLPTFEVDVVRRWPSVSKARELLGWEAQIAVEDGVAATVEWLRGVLQIPAA